MTWPGTMIPSATAACPACGGLVMPGHPGGLLAIDHRAACGLRAGEDATAAADAQRRSHQRPATEVERALLQAVYGLADLPNDLHTDVEFVTHAVRRRSWPALSELEEDDPR